MQSTNGYREDIGIQLKTPRGETCLYYPFAKAVLLGKSLHSNPVPVGALKWITERSAANERKARRWQPLYVGEKFLGTVVYLIPTNQCQLRCTYCYSDAGERVDLIQESNDSPTTLGIEDTRAAIKTVCNTARIFQDIGRNEKASVRFIGGGEPTFNWNWLKDSIDFAKKTAEGMGVPLELRLVTNGVYSEDRANWLARNFDAIHLSIDGPPDIQDVQRPLPIGTGSSKYVMRSMKLFCESDAKTTVRSTWTDLAVGRGREIAEFFFSESPRLRAVHVEPGSASPIGRTHFSPPTTQAFVETFKEAYIATEELGYGGRFITTRIATQIKTSYCESTQGRAVYVTPTGDITNCNEVADEGDPRWKEFHMGEVVGEPRELRVLPELATRAIESGRTNSFRAECEGCIAQWSCRGGCRAAYLADPNKWVDNWCAQVQPLTEWIIGRLVDKAMEGGYGQVWHEEDVTGITIPDFPDWKMIVQ